MAKRNRAAEIYRGSAIFYAPGNFVLDHNHPMFLPCVKESFIVRCFVEEKRIARASLVPVLIGGDGRPVLLTDQNERYGEIMEMMGKMSDKLGARLKISAGEAVLIPQ